MEKLSAHMYSSGEVYLVNELPRLILDDGV